MNRLTSALAVAAFAFAALPALAADPTAPMVFALTAQNGSGEIGTVVLTPMGDKTKVDVAIVGAPAGVIQPDHIHTGTCAKLDPKPAYGLAALTNGVSSTVVPVSMATLLASPFAVNVHKSAAEIATYVSCGNLTASMPGMKM